MKRIRPPSYSPDQNPNDPAPQPVNVCRRDPSLRMKFEVALIIQKKKIFKLPLGGRERKKAFSFYHDLLEITLKLRANKPL